ncbi:hypothetical protein ES708_28025 [subsurface metagenome]
MIDEVMAGFNESEARSAIRLIQKIIEEHHITIVWVEHIMKIIMEATQRVVVLNYGEVLTTGVPREVVNDPRVIEAYLGEEDA